MNTPLFASGSQLRPVRGRLVWTVCGLALGMLFAVCLLPQTRWLLGKQIQSLFQAETSHSLAIPIPEDPALQTAAAFLGDHPDSKGLNQVALKFPNSPIPRAALLRCYLRGRRYASRPEESWLPSLNRPVDKPSSDSNTFAGYDYQDFERIALEGEQRDPNNAFFSWMLALVHFDTGRDAFALGDIVRASEKFDYNDYAYEETLAEIHLKEQEKGPLTASERDVILTSPWRFGSECLAPMRHVARMVRFQAAVQESKGNVAQGVALRAALARAAVTVQNRSRYLITALVAKAILAIAAANPEGKEIKFANSVSAEQRKQEHLDAYIAFLKKHGYAAEAQWYSAETERTKRIMQLASDFEESPGPHPTTIYTLISKALLSEGILFGILAAITGILCYQTRLRIKKPVPDSFPTRLGIGTGLTFGTVLGLMAETGRLRVWLDDIIRASGDFSAGAEIMTAALILGALPIVFCLQSRAFRNGAANFVLASGGCLLLLWLTCRLANTLQIDIMALSPYQDIAEDFVPESTFWVHLRNNAFLLAGLALLAPLLLYVIGVAFRSWRRQLPLRETLIRSLHRVTLPGTALLLIGLAVNTCLLARQEHANAIQHMDWLHDEINYQRKPQPPTGKQP